MGFVKRAMRDTFEEKKPEALKADIRMISGCEDAQTSADVSNVADFKLPDTAGRAGGKIQCINHSFVHVFIQFVYNPSHTHLHSFIGACTSTLLSILYDDGKTPEDTLTFVQVLEMAREKLKKKGTSTAGSLLLLVASISHDV
jgi:hypothetical protein